MSILIFLADYRNLCHANLVYEGTAMHTFENFLWKLTKPFCSLQIVHRGMRQEYYKFYTVRFSTYVHVVYSLLDTYASNKILADADAILRDMKMARTDTPTNFEVCLMKCPLRFGGVYTKVQLLSDMVYDKLASLAENLHQMTNSTPPTTASTTPRISRSSLSK